MLNFRTDDRAAIATLRSFLDEVGYGYVCHRTIPDHDTHVWPSFAAAHTALKPLHPRYRILFSVLRIGYPAQPRHVLDAMPREVADALFACGLLVEDAFGEWRTPGVGLVNAMGLDLVTSIPPHYPTAATTKQPIYIGLESIWLGRALPSSVSGRALDVCAGSGIQGLLCAQRGAQSVVGLEIDPYAASAARLNAALNGLADRVEIRESDLYAALRDDEAFDLVVSNPPFMPVSDDVGYPICGAGGIDGTVLLREIFAGLPVHLTEGGRFVMFCNVLGDRASIAINHEVLRPLAERAGLRIRAFVTDKHTLAEYEVRTLEPNLRNTCPDLSAPHRKLEIERWRRDLATQAPALTHIYGQILDGIRDESRRGVYERSDYNPILTDPLVAALRSAERAG